jgi:DNA-binding IclR family transcriptional regulator
VQDIAEKLDIPPKQAEHMLATLEAQPTVTRELLVRRSAQAWLEG